MYNGVNDENNESSFNSDENLYHYSYSKDQAPQPGQPDPSQGREQPARPRADDHRRRLRRPEHLRQPVRFRRIRRYPLIPHPPQHGFLLPQLHCGGVHQPQLLYPLA